MTYPGVIFNPEHPCPACEGVRFFRRSGSCVNCVMNRKVTCIKGAIKKRQMMNLSPLYPPQNPRSPKFKSLESKVMDGVRYDDA